MIGEPAARLGITSIGTLRFALPPAASRGTRAWPRSMRDRFPWHPVSEAAARRRLHETAFSAPLSVKFLALFAARSNLMPTPRKGKIDFLKGLRGAGAMAVMAGHPIGAFFPAAAFGTPDNVHAAADLPSYNLPVLHVFFDGGFAGYVLTLNPARWKTSAIKRFPRLMIPAFASVMLAYLVIKSGLVFNPAAAPPSKSIWLGYFYKQPADFLSALHEALIGAVLPGHATYNSSLWTMAFEFYGAPLCLALAVMCEPLRRGKTAVYVLRHSRRSMLADRRNQPAADR